MSKLNKREDFIPRQMVLQVVKYILRKTSTKESHDLMELTLR